MKGIALTLAKIALTKYLVKAGNEEKAWKWAQSTYGDEAPQVWTAVTGNPPPKAAAPAPKPAPTPKPAPATKPKPKPAPVVAEEDEEAATTTTTASTTNDFAAVTKWSGTNYSGWKQTVAISDVKVIGKNIHWSGGSERLGKWNEFTDGGKRINGECCLVFGNVGGFFDYLGQKQNNKLLTGNVEEFLGRRPVKGEQVGFFLATVHRKASARKMQERSNVVWITWPKDI